MAERDSCWNTKFWLSVLCLYQCSVERSWMFHAKLQTTLLLFTVWDLCITGCGSTFGLECWQLTSNGPFFLRTQLIMHAWVLGTRTPISIQRKLGSALVCLRCLHRFLQATCTCSITHASIHMRMSNMYISVCKVRID